MAQLVLLLMMGTLAVLAEEDWTSNCDKCKCTWSDGRKKADCRNTYLSTIPNNLSPELRDLDFSSNKLYELRNYAFSSVNLQDVHKLKMRNCSIQFIDKLAFANLALLIELDLSKNEIRKLDEITFQDNRKLRTLCLNYNKLQELKGTLFHNLSHLQRIEVNNNEISYVDPYVFSNGPTLQYIDLSNNKLKYLDPQLIENLNKLISLNIQSNPWICDCKLQKLRELVVESYLLTAPTACSEPLRLKNRLWAELHPRDFACTPKILEPSTDILLQVKTTNVTISCKVKGDPLPDIDWVSNGRILDQESQQKSKYISTEKQEGNLLWSNLTILNVNYRDRGEYKCVAKNPGGTDERNISLAISSDLIGGGGGAYGSSTSASVLALLIGFSIAIIILLIVVALLVFYCIRKNSRNSRSKPDDITQSGDYISLNGRPEMEKSLITEVNPVTKPPRQYSVPPSVTSGVTELSDVKKNLLDNDSNFAIDDESRSFDFEAPAPTKSQNQLNYTGENQLPPDLLSFPHRGIQVSPSGSTASTVPDQTKLPQYHGPQSPLHSPMYDSLNLYRTLPYSRSQSPFTTPLGAPVVTPRPGAYVTIPRRPRASWSSEPPNHPIVADPVYDNLGLRTTAAGNSLLSLNRLGDTPKGNRALPVTPNYGPAGEQPNVPVAATLPRSNLMHRTPTTPSTEDQRGWLRNGSDIGSIQESSLPNSRRDSTASLIPSPDGKVTKIPPRPPPKPKKRASAGPLFEDEGEDGTEV